MPSQQNYGRRQHVHEGEGVICAKAPRTSSRECRGVGCESASACVHVSDVSARVRVRVMPEVDMATQSEAHVAQMHASASDPARARAGKGGRGAHAQAGPECSAAAPRCITEACAPGRVSAAARACACTAGPHLPGSRRRVLPKALARQTLRRITGPGSGVGRDQKSSIFSKPDLSQTSTTFRARWKRPFNMA